MLKTLRKKTSFKVIVISGVLIFLGWGYFYFFSSQKEQKKVLEEKLYSYTRLLCKKNSILNKKKQVDSLYKQAQQLYLTASCESDASVQLQEIVSSIAEESGTSIDRLEVPRVYKEENGEQFIKMRVYFSGQPSTILEFLYNLEKTKRPRLILDEFELRKVKTWVKKQRVLQIKGYVCVKALLKIGGKGSK